MERPPRSTCYLAIQFYFDSVPFCVSLLPLLFGKHSVLLFAHVMFVICSYDAYSQTPKHTAPATTTCPLQNIIETILIAIIFDAHQYHHINVNNYICFRFQKNKIYSYEQLLTTNCI